MCWPLLSWRSSLDYHLSKQQRCLFILLELNSVWDMPIPCAFSDSWLVHLRQQCQVRSSMWVKHKLLLFQHGILPLSTWHAARSRVTCKISGSSQIYSNGKMALFLPPGFVSGTNLACNPGSSSMPCWKRKYAMLKKEEFVLDPYWWPDLTLLP